jgi:hypothetical protein
MRANKLHLITGILFTVLLGGCKQEKEEFQSAPLSDYTPLQVGKYITYHLDSTIFTNFGSATVVHSYQEKHLVDAQITDALGRPAFRMTRWTRDTAGTQPWVSAGTYSITPLASTVEVIENNLRFIKLVLPVTQDNTWKGNRYLPDDAYAPFYNFNNDFGMDAWDYSYTSTDGNLTLKGQRYDHVLTVDGIDESFNANSASTNYTNPSVIAYVNFLQDKYAKGIGLIYQDFIMWEYQPPNGVSGTGSKVGFGVHRSMIDHN